MESTWQNVILLWQLWQLWLRQHSYQLWVQMSPLPHCLPINTCPHTAAPHTRTDAMLPEIVQLFSHFQVNIATEEDTGKAYKDTTYINLIPGLWMDVNSVTSVYQSPCCRLHSPHPTFRILRGHSQGSAHCAPVTVMSSPGSWCCYSVESFNCSPTYCSAVEQHGTFTANFGIFLWYESLKYWK